MSFAVTMIISVLLNAAFDFDNPSTFEFKDTEIPSVESRGLKTDSKDITLMVFMNAKNNLSESHLFGLVGEWAKKDIDEMKKVGSTDRVNVIVEVGEKNKASRRMRIVKKTAFSSGEEVMMEDRNADMGSYERVVDFVRWAKTKFPAKRYVLVLWNHGLGWIDPALSQHTQGTGTSSKGILFDDETKNYVRTRQMSEMFKRMGYVDVVVFNACLMQMAEVDYEIKDYTSLIIGSEETMLAFGFDYEKFIRFLDSNPSFSKKQMADFFIDWYKEFYKNGVDIGLLNIPLNSIAATLSAVEPSELKNLPQYLNYFASNVINNNEEDAVKYAVEKVIRFTSIADPVKDKEKKIAPYVDLYDFVRLVGEKAKKEETKKASMLLMDFIKNKLIINSVGLNKDTTNGYDYSLVGGISINMTMKIKPVPSQFDSILETKYSDISLSKDSYWDEFVNWTTEVWNR